MKLTTPNDFVLSKSVTDKIKCLIEEEFSKIDKTNKSSGYVIVIEGNYSDLYRDEVANSYRLAGWSDVTHRQYNVWSTEFTFIV